MKCKNCGDTKTGAIILTSEVNGVTHCVECGKILNFRQGEIKMNLIEMNKARYEELLKQKEDVERELDPLKKYLEALGALVPSKRTRRKKEDMPK